MIILSWNCRGLGNLRAVPTIKDLIRTNRPDIIFLFETLVQASKIEEIRVKIGFDFAFVVDREGRGGAVTVLWKSTVNCNILNHSLNFINLEVNHNFKGSRRLTGFYGIPDRTKRKESWNLLYSLAGMSQLPWCVIGDFNDILSEDEKRARVDHHQWLLNG